jgi:hypothetical protein
MSYMDKLAAHYGELEKEAAGPSTQALRAAKAGVAAAKETARKKNVFAPAVTATGARAGGAKKKSLLARLGEATGFTGSTAERGRALKSRKREAAAAVAGQKGRAVKDVGATRKAEGQLKGQTEALSRFRKSPEYRRMMAKRVGTVAAGTIAANKGLGLAFGDRKKK